MNAFSYLQRLGKALRLPIATLPVAAILLRLGQPDVFNIPFIASAGGGIFDSLPLLFALGIAIGLAKDNAGAAALAGAVGFLVLTKATAVINASINMSFFAGIIAGVVAGHCYNRFSNTKLPDFLAFFAGKRLVPIMTGLICLFIAWVCGYVWPSVQHGIDTFSLLVSRSGEPGWFIYGVLNRALIPFGLHYILHSVFWFSLGDCLKVTYDAASAVHNICLAPDVVKGLVVGGTVPGIEGSTITQIATDLTRGDLNRFFAGDPHAGVYMAWAYPIFMGGLPGAALAMYFAAPKARRSAVGGMLLSVALTAFLTGITEPIDVPCSCPVRPACSTCGRQHGDRQQPRRAARLWFLRRVDRLCAQLGACHETVDFNPADCAVLRDLFCGVHLRYSRLQAENAGS